MPRLTGRAGDGLLATELTSSQRAFLRSRGRLRSADVIVGKAGLSRGALGHIRAMLARQELLKVKLPRLPEASRRAVAQELAHAAGAELVDVVGHMVVLYRPNDQLPPEKRLVLPE